MRKNRKQSATTWSAEEKKSIAAVRNDLSVSEFHQVNYAQTVARATHKKAAMARMDERIKTALKFL